jgi:hypothetical protein
MCARASGISAKARTSWLSRIGSALFVRTIRAIDGLARDGAFGDISGGIGGTASGAGSTKTSDDDTGEDA